jgi:hypothetical protein
MKVVYKKEIMGITDDEKKSSELIINEYGEGIERKLGEEIELDVYVKTYGKIKTNEYEVNLRVLCSGNKSCSGHFFESNASERDFSRAVHSALKKLDTEIEHRLHISDNGKS